MAPSRVVFVDGTGLLARAYQVESKALRTPSGFPTNALYGFAKMFRRVLSSKTTRHGAVILGPIDEDDTSWPNELRRQFSDLDRFVRAHNFPVVRVAKGHVHDMIAALCIKARDEGHDVWIVGHEREFAHWIDAHVRVFDPIEDVLYDQETVFRTRGLAPDDLRAQRAPTTLPSDTPALDTLHTPFPSVERLDQVYQSLAFHAFVSPLAGQQKGQPLAYFICDTVERARAAVDAETQGPVSVYVIAEKGPPFSATPVGIALSPELGKAIYLPFDGDGAHLTSRGWRLLKVWAEDPARPKVVHDAKAVLHAFAQHAITLRGVVGDIGLASYLLDPTATLPHRIDQVVRNVLHVGLQSVRTIVGSGRQAKTFAQTAVDRTGAYACHCADAIGAVWRKLAPELQETGLITLHRDVDLPLSDVLARMERRGLAVDPSVLSDLDIRWSAKRDALQRQLEEQTGHRIRIGSHRQVGTLLFEKLDLPVLKRTKTGYSVDQAVLTELATQHPAPATILAWRRWDKLIQSYTTVLRRAIRDDGRVHSTVQQTVSASGRLITTEPDLQRTPARTSESRQVRAAIIAPDDHVLMSADWSQLELRLMAHFSKDEALVDAFRTQQDVHRHTAAALFECDAKAVTKEQRDVGKTVNFATIYGQGADALSRQLGTRVDVARAYIERFFAHFQGIDTWRRQIVLDARRQGFVQTLAGRRRFIPELYSDDQRHYGERIAVNTPIQGSGADLCKLALLRVDRALRRHQLKGHVVLQIHDELLLEVPIAEVEPTQALVTHIMTHIWPLDVPMSVVVTCAPTWADAQP